MSDTATTPAYAPARVATAGFARPARDPIGALLGARRPDWFAVFVGLAILVHVAVLLFALVIGLLKDIHDAVVENRARIQAYFFTQYDVDLAPKPKAPEPPKMEEPPPPPEPKPEPAPVKQLAPKPKDDPYDQPPPAPAKAAAVLTAKDEPNEPKAMLDTIVSGDGTAAYGAQSAEGKGDKPVTNPNASNKGVPGGTGTGTATVPPPPPVDRSSSPTIQGGTAWNCPFPPEADAEQIDQAVATIIVTVKPDGSPLSVSVVADPGHGFGRAARICALGRRYTPGLDASGTPVAKSTPPINVRFSR